MLQIINNNNNNNNNIESIAKMILIFILSIWLVVPHRGHVRKVLNLKLSNYALVVQTHDQLRNQSFVSSSYHLIKSDTY